MSDARLTRWDGPGPSGDELQGWFAEEGLEPHAWGNAPDDRLEIDPGTDHAATVGPDGVRCLEASR